MRKFLQRLGITFVLILGVAIFTSHTGRSMIKSSSVYEKALIEVQKRYGIEPSLLSIPTIRPFKFSEGYDNGFAKFLLCDEDSCYQIIAHKHLGVWKIDIEN